MPMLALVSWMLMPSYASYRMDLGVIFKIILISVLKFAEISTKRIPKWIRDTANALSVVSETLLI
jgi:hypothetical protein